MLTELLLSLSLHGKCDQEVMCLNNSFSLVQASVTELLLNVKKITFWNTFNGIYTTLNITIMVHVK